MLQGAAWAFIMDIVVWLRSLGLERYEAAFRENEINERVLPSLTQEDLKEIGVGPVGHRRILLEAIAALRSDAGGKAPSADAVIPSAVPSASPEDRAERRQVTVMFADLVGSTALSARMDPEDLREVISAYQKCVAETVQHFGGFVAKYMGDGVLIYFGYPQAHEDDAERAVRTGLELVHVISELKTHAALQTRVGVATGLVVVGDLIGSGASQEQAIVGETPNLAARLQGIAEPNSVLISESTRKLVGNLFELEDLGAQDLKGISGPVRAWAALRPSSVESRFEAMHASGVSELVGREEELDLLLRRWSKVKNGEGQVVLLSGEPGIGKSRLTAALLDRLAAEPHTRLRYFCSPQHTDSALYPIISQMERAARITHDETAQAKLDKLDALLAQSFTPSPDAALLAEMVSLPNNGRYQILELTPQQRRQKTLEALTTQVEALSRSNAVVMIFEDAHWTDPTSLEAFGRTVDRLKTLRVLLIITYRPEFEPPWIGRPYVTALNLNRLGEREIAAMIDRVTGNKALSKSIRHDIIERADGIPLFVEEITKAVLEAEGEGAAGSTGASIPSSSTIVPASLHASLMARLDRLGPAKEVAQIGAVIGREFPHSLLAAIANKSEAELKSAIDRLVDAGLLFRQGQPPHAKYLFKHALVQDAAYGTLLRDPRRALHARIAEILETQFDDIAELQPEQLARHCTEAGLIEKAALQWGKAGYRSLARSALVEAVAQITRALEQIATLHSTPDLRRQWIELQVALITPLVHIKGYAAPETKAAAEQAHLLIKQSEALGEPSEDALLLFSALYGCWVSSYVTFKGDVAVELSRQFLALAEEKGTTAPLIIGHRIVGISSLFSGDIPKGRAHFDQAIAFYDPTKHRSLATRFGVDAAVSVLCYRSWALWMLGYPETALTDTELALKEAHELGQAATLMYAQAHGLWPQMWAGNYTAAGRLLDEAVALANEKSAMHWKTLGMIGQGCLLSSATTNFSDAVQIISAGIAEYRSTGATVWLPLILSYLALAKTELGHFDDALRCLDEAMTAIQTTGERWCEAEVFRTAGQIALKVPKQDAQKAAMLFEHALAIARQQQAKSWELRAAMSMARLWRDQGKAQQARELLAPIYGWFTEGFDTLDLKEAKALLSALSQRS
jgi:class 3 adenylate cyclase/predicted ATPase